MFSGNSSYTPDRDIIIYLADAIYDKFSEKEFQSLCIRIGVDKDIKDRLEGDFRKDTYHLVNYCVDTGNFDLLLQQVLKLRPPLEQQFTNLLSQTNKNVFPPQLSTPVTRLSKGVAIESCWDIIQLDNVEIRELKETLESPQRRLEIASGNISIAGFLKKLEQIRQKYRMLKSQKKNSLLKLTIQSISI